MFSKSVFICRERTLGCWVAGVLGLLVGEISNGTPVTLEGSGVDMVTLGTLVGVDVYGNLGTSLGPYVGRTADKVSRLLKISLRCWRTLWVFLSLGGRIGEVSVWRRVCVRSLASLKIVWFASADGIFKLWGNQVKVWAMRSELVLENHTWWNR